MQNQLRYGQNLQLRVKLLKKDPLNKFKLEMNSWWFCKEYIVIESSWFEIYNIIPQVLIK